jgi:hypothetical protein
MPRLLPLVLVALVASLVSAGARADKTFDKTFPLPRDGGIVPVNGKAGVVVITHVDVRNAPNKADYDKAKTNPGESSHPKFQVRLSNPGSDKVKVKVVVKLEGADGSTLLNCDTGEKLKAGTKDFDSNLCWLQGVHVSDWPKAKLHLVVTSSD